MIANEMNNAAPIATKAIIPPSFSVFFQVGFVLNTLPKNKITGIASIGNKMIRGAYSAIEL